MYLIETEHQVLVLNCDSFNRIPAGFLFPRLDMLGYKSEEPLRHILRIRFFTTSLLACAAIYPLAVFAGATDETSLLENLEHEFQITLFASRLEGISLGDDLLIDSQNEEEIRFEFDLRYTANEHFFVFLGGSFFNLSQELNRSKIGDSITGYEREETGVGSVWGDKVAFQLDIGRLEHVDRREWWWDEFLDSLRLQVEADEFDITLAHGKEQRPATTVENFIDPGKSQTT